MARLAEQADAVAVVTVTSVSGISPALTVSMRLDRTLQGAPGASVSFRWPGTLRMGESLLGLHGLVFLSRNPQGLWQAIPVATPVILTNSVLVPLPVGDLPAKYSYQSSEPVVDKLAKELRAGTDSTDDALSSEAFSRLTEFLAPQSPTFAHTLALGPAHQSTCFSMQVARDYGGLLINRINAILTADPTHRLSHGMLLALCSLHDPAAVPVLGQLRNSAAGGADVQRCVARAFQNIRTKEAVPHLAALLGSDDQEIRYRAVSGLAAFANGCPYDAHPLCQPQPYSSQATLDHYPSVAVFEANEAPYIAFWQAWAADFQTNHAPSTTIIGPSGCHPTKSHPCQVALVSSATDMDGDPLSYTWSGCATGTSALATCSVPSLSAVTAASTVADGRGGVTSASATVTGVNAAPTCTTPGGTICSKPYCSIVFTFKPSDSDADSVSATCANALSTNGTKCTYEGTASGGVKTGTITVKDSWGATGTCTQKMKWHDACTRCDQ